MHLNLRALPGGGLCNHGSRAHVALEDRGHGFWRIASNRLYPAALGRLLATALVDGLPATDEAADDIDDADRERLRFFEVAVGRDELDVDGWRDLDSATLRARRAREAARENRKRHALERIKTADLFVDGVLRDVGEETPPPPVDGRSRTDA